MSLAAVLNYNVELMLNKIKTQHSRGSDYAIHLTLMAGTQERIGCVMMSESQYISTKRTVRM